MIKRIAAKLRNAALTAYQLYMALTAPIGMMFGMEHIHKQQIEHAEELKVTPDGQKRQRHR